MFDFGFSELMLIGAVALVVLGPEKLPIVARTAGQWLGKAQRMVQQVKSDIEREAELSELKKIQQEAKGIADDLTKTVKGQMQAIESDVKAVQNDVDSAARELTQSFEGTKSAFSDLGNSSTASASDELASAFDSAAQKAEKTDGGDDNSSEFYDWYNSQDAYVDEEPSTRTTFDKRYKCGPSIDELAQEIERLKTELGDRAPQLGGYNRKLAARARSNRVRIYR